MEIMAKFNVKLKNGQVVPMEAPDDWSTEQVQEAIHKNFPDESSNQSQIPETPFNNRVAPEPERTGVAGLAGDAADLFGQALKSGTQFVEDIPENASKIGQDFKKDPVQALGHHLGQLHASNANLMKAAVNSPHDLLKYMLKKHLAIDIPLGGNFPKINDLTGIEQKHAPTMMSDLIPHIPEDTGVEKALGLEAKPERGDELTRAIPAIAALGSGGASVVKSLVKALKSPSKKNLFIRAFEEKIAAAKKAKDMSEKDIQTLKDTHETLYSNQFKKPLGRTSPTGQRVSIDVKTGKMEKLRPEAEIPEEKVGEIPHEPDTKSIIDEKNSVAQAARERAETTLGLLDHPRLKGSVPINKAIEDVHKSSSDLYNSSRKFYEDKHVTADNSAEIKSITSDLEAMKKADDLAPGYGSGSETQKALESHLEALKGETVEAKDLFDLQRTLEKMAKNTRDKQYSSGKLTQIERDRLDNIASNFQNHASGLAKRLESVGGKEVQSMIKEANKGWKIYKDLSERNPIGKGAIAGEIPARTMIELAKNHPSNEFLNALVQSNPDLKRYVLASHVGESSINKLVKPATLTKQYLAELPEVEEHVIAFKEALADVKTGERQAAKVKKEHDALVTSMKEAANRQKARQSAIAERDTLSKQIKFHEKSIPEIEAKMKKYEADSTKHAKLQKELDMHKRNLQEKNHLLKKLLKSIVNITGLSTIAHKVGL
jgi:hypothetical protein